MRAGSMSDFDSPTLCQKRRLSDQMRLPQQVRGPGGVFGRERRIERKPVVEQVVPSPFVALVDQWLQVQGDVGIGRAQRDAGTREPVAEPNRIHLALPCATGPENADAIGRASFTESAANTLGKQPGALPHQVHLHNARPATVEAAPPALKTLALVGFKFVAWAEPLEHRNQPSGRVADFYPALNLILDKHPQRFGARWCRGVQGDCRRGGFLQPRRFAHLNIRTVRGPALARADHDRFLLGSRHQVRGQSFLQGIATVGDQHRMRVPPPLLDERIHPWKRVRRHHAQDDSTSGGHQARRAKTEPRSSARETLRRVADHRNRRDGLRIETT